MTTPASDSDALGPDLVAEMRRQGEAFAPDNQSRERVWKQLQAKMHTKKTSRVSVWWAALCSSPKRWAPALAAVALVSLALPVLLEQEPQPDWAASDFKGGQTHRLALKDRAAFLAALSAQKISYSALPLQGADAIAISAVETSMPNAVIRSKWAISVPMNVTVYIVFE